MEEKVEFRTTDLFLSACLMVEGIHYIRSEKQDTDFRRMIFVFEYSPEIERIKQQRANATHVASTVHYDESLRRLKSIVHGN